MQFQMFDAKNTYNAQGTAAKADPRLCSHRLADFSTYFIDPAEKDTVLFFGFEPLESLLKWGHLTCPYRSMHASMMLPCIVS